MGVPSWDNEHRGMSGRQPIRVRTTLAVVVAGLWAGLMPWLRGTPTIPCALPSSGDRTRETQPSVYELVCKEAAAGTPTKEFRGRQCVILITFRHPPLQGIYHRALLRCIAGEELCPHDKS